MNTLISQLAISNNYYVLLRMMAFNIDDKHKRHKPLMYLLDMIIDEYHELLSLIRKKKITDDEIKSHYTHIKNRYTSMLIYIQRLFIQIGLNERQNEKLTEYISDLEKSEEKIEQILFHTLHSNPL